MLAWHRVLLPGLLFMVSAFAEEGASVLTQPDPAARLAAAKLPVPAPETIRFTDPVERAVYLTEYEAAYRSILAKVEIDCHLGVVGPTLRAWREGWADGIIAVRRNHPEIVAEMMGVPLMMYLATLKEGEGNTP